MKLWKQWQYRIAAPAFVLALAFAPLGAVVADEPEVDDDDDVEMEVVSDPEAGEEEFVEEIRLPEQASDQARESAAQGLETANEAREGGREFGQERAEEARETGRDARETRGRPEGAGSQGQGGQGQGGSGRN